ncbi:Uncharacterized conserved protein, DUF1015 family [Butyrivibrio fibrisolvens DSM 3071]|uniref:Uncharacterized conserved protein, DUF1015 family n=1 Tax=Butyrivibrio fibrisolvens DSM 3071 TaxID=1121131 RepID=A0A1M5SUT2_BUTFI|nr:DUF1015 family protein [Butyrivibrio fibrisolvens]SHH42285.1 Uncharacterized conserved protein, DUF1015 family [Butyrivibrio fibrisolvens DSM 3071]
MASIRPFKAYRPEPSLADKCAALPYDVFNSKEARVEVEKEPLSFLAIDRPETQFEEGHDIYADDVYKKAHDILWNRIDKGIYVQDSVPCFYVYEQTMDGRKQTGLVGCASIDDYVNNVIKKHENTLEKKEQDRIRHVDACDAQTGPIFLGYRNNKEIDKIVEKIKYTQTPVYEFTSKDGVINRVWVAADEDDVKKISDIFETIDSIYIADGHHRCASAVKVGLKRRSEDSNPTGQKEYDYFLSVLFPENELMIMDYNRVVKDLNGLSDQEFMDKLKEKYDVKELGKEAVKPVAKYHASMYMNNIWYDLVAKESVRKDDAVEGLDVSILQNEILDPVLGIKDPKNDSRIDFVGGIRGLKELERRCHEDMKIAFAMYPTSIGELFAVADAGKLMPPKSTWFEPKLLSGLFIHTF